MGETDYFEKDVSQVVLHSKQEFAVNNGNH
jgi:hypothetical protein